MLLRTENVQKQYKDFKLKCLLKSNMYLDRMRAIIL